MNLQGKINLIKLAKEAIKNAIISMGIIPSGNISTYADAITQIDTVNNTSLTVSPSTTSQTLRPSSEYTGYGVVNVNPVTASIDSDIVASNIKTGVEILGVTGEVDELIGQTKTVTENGVYTPDNGYTGFTSVTVDTPPGLRMEVTMGGIYQKPTSSFTFSLPENTIDIGSYAMYYAFYGCTGLTNVDLSNLHHIGGGISSAQAFSRAFVDCENLISVDLSNLSFIGSTGNQGAAAFQQTFYNCTSLTNVDLSNLSVINSNNVFKATFQGCHNLRTLSFPSLVHVESNATFNNMLYDVSGCKVHFPSNLQSVIGSWSDVVSGFGGTNTTVLFDLPATT